ncbi:serine/threonine-protein kinase [Streptomyces sp. NPDC093676]|uniref:serine/threonine-protein kinase n=1 Tax=Streptomyces sp. NPDC093676 TaxID=3366050 RepID=UPI00382D1664
MDALEQGDPEQVGPYRIAARLGAGGMGRVYVGHSRSGRTAAVKVVHAELAEDAEFRRRFVREVAAAQRVSGAFTAPVLGADPESDPPWLATLYVPGPGLSDVIGAHGALPEGSVRLLGAGLLEALAAIHSAGLVHRDLKPSNVLLAADGPRVIDFGISAASEFSALTRTGSVVGTPGFMSPEQLVGKPVGPASDVFSLGALLVFAATGEGAFGQGPVQAVMYRIVHEQARLDAVPEALRTPLARALAKDPADRPEVVELLAELLPHGASVSELGSLGERQWLPSAVAATLSLHDAPTVTPPGGVASGGDEDRQGTWLGRVLRTRRRPAAVTASPVPPADAPAPTPEAVQDVVVPPAPPADAPGPAPQSGVAVPSPIAETLPEPTATSTKLAANAFESFTLDAEAGALDCLVDGERTLAVMVAENGTTPTVWDLNAQAQTGVLEGHTKAVRDVCCVQLEGRSAAITAGDDGTIRIWDLTDHALLHTITYPPDAPLVQKVFCAELDGVPVVVAASWGDMGVYDLRTFSEIQLAFEGRPQGDVVGCAQIDGRPVLLTAHERAVEVWDLATRSLVRRLVSPLPDLWDASYIKVGDRILVIGGGNGDDRQLPVWDLATGKQSRVLLQDGTGYPTSALWCTRIDGRPVVVAGEHHFVRIWDLGTFSEVASTGVDALPGEDA